ncbi:MAG: glutamate-1-semialdehyde 2,1-aminomutase [Planctomycetota bacterium]
MTAGPRSQGLFERACRLIPGGVSSPVRAFRAVGGTPPFITSARGAHVTDADGRTYLDFIGSWGPLALGHAHPEVIAAITEAAARGTTYGLPCPGEVELASILAELSPVVEQVRFVSSGTEAVMSAVRLARGVTGRDKIVKLAGCYHGHADHLLVQAGSGLATFGVPSSAGVPAAFAGQTIVLPLDDEEAATRLFREQGAAIAAVLIEPIPANHGLLLQRPAYLEHLRTLTRQAGALLVFDEVISGFRVAPGGAAELYGITPDLVTYGKVVGGGMPVGAFGGPRATMRQLAPEGPVYQAGTLSGNPVAMAAGATALRVLRRENAWTRLEALGARLEAAARPLLEPHGVRLVRVGSVFWLDFAVGEPTRRPDRIAADAADRFRGLFNRLLDDGILMAPSAYEVGFLSLAHTPEHVDRLAAAWGSALS